MAGSKRSGGSSEKRSLRDSLSSALASPRGILVAVPLMVGGLGAALTLLWQSAMRSSNIDSARSKFVAETQVVAQTIDASLAQAAPMRARLHEIASAWRPDDEPTVHGYELSDLLLGHPGVVYVSVSFPDGTFSGAFYEDGAVRFQVSRMVGADASDKTVWDPTHRAGLIKLRDERQSYDPRKRGFYSLAASSDHAVFTDPYPFYRTWVTGITSAEAVRNEDNSVHAVITIDFDMGGLSHVLETAPAPEGSRFVLSTDGGVILAVPRLRERYPDLTFPVDRPLRASDVPDPLLRAIVADTSGHAGVVRDLEIDGQRFLATSLRVGEAEGLPWRVSVAEPEANFLGSLPRYQRWSLAASTGALAFAFALSVLFARHVTRARREVLRARAEARAAVGKARELGSYRLVERLAAGGMGELWRAEHRLLARPAAVKLIRLDERTSTEDAKVAEERFRREAQTLATLESRNTVKVLDYGVADDGTLYLVMELLHGLDLERLVEAEGPQPAARVIRFLLQALGSLAEAHDEGLVHRDIKPANLFLSRAADEVDILKVVDFGLVRAADDEKPSRRRPAVFDGAGAEAILTSKKGFVGTPAYMAPEQILQQRIDGRADLYALGCVAYFLLTGKCVFGNDAAVTVIVGHMTLPPPSLHANTSQWLPDELVALVEACLAKKPEARPKDARTLAERLRSISIPVEHAWTEEKARAFWDAFEAKAEAARAERARGEEQGGAPLAKSTRELVVRETPS